MKTDQDLFKTLKQLDGSQYGAYKRTKGQYQFPGFILSIDHIQGDPFAAPSKLRVFIKQSEAKIPEDCFSQTSREIATREYLTRQFHESALKYSRNCGSGKSGLISIDAPGQQILERSSCFVNSDEVEFRFVAGLPANGRRILGYKATMMLAEFLPSIIEHTFSPEHLNRKELLDGAKGAEDADFIRKSLPEKGLVAFVANGSLLPRRSGIDDRPLDKEALPFKAPSSMEVTMETPNHGALTGMGIKEGVTLIVGGGYHGKSTLLKALEHGVYNHFKGDGREWVITIPDAVKVRAEDGRAVTNVTITPFINNLPRGKDTEAFCTENASGSTSQATNIIEAVEAQCRALLIDEDTSATNFMIRDRRMQELIHKDKEPITPFADKVRQIKEDLGISSIIVMGGSGDYFDTCDHVIAMEDYQPHDYTEQTKAVAQKFQTGRSQEGGKEFGRLRPRVVCPESFDPSRGRRELSLKVRSVDEIQFGNESIDLSAVEQLVHESQMRAIGMALVKAKQMTGGKEITLPELLTLLDKQLSNTGIESLSDFPEGDLAKFRRFELAAAINRMRSLRIR